MDLIPTNKASQPADSELKSLMILVATKDRDAFKQLYDLTHKQIYAYLFRFMNDKSLVDDVLMETFTEVWKHAERFKFESKITTWIIGIARNLAMNKMNRTKQFDELITADEPSFEEHHDDQNAQKIMAKALPLLASNHREILGLILLPEYSYQQIADILDIPINTVKSRIFYAKEALRKVLDTLGVDENAV